MSLLPGEIHPSWNGFLTPYGYDLLHDIEKHLSEPFSPDKEKMLRFLSTDFDHTKIVILGQDPYPEKGVAVGRAFEVGALRSWDQPFRQVSLKNIIRLIYRSINDVQDYNDIPTFKQILEEIKSGKFLIADPPEWFNSLEKQGVLFLNTCFSVEPGRPLSHRELWQPFSEKLIEWISQKNPELYWFLWGNNAKEFKPFICKGRLFESKHPMMCSDSYSDDFLKNDCIRKTMKIIDWTGKTVPAI